MWATINLNIVFFIILLFLFIAGTIISNLIVGNINIIEISVAFSIICLVLAMLYGINKFEPRLEYILYVVFSFFFIGVTCLIILDLIGEKIVCNLNETNFGTILSFFFIFIIGTLNFNLIFLNGKIKIPYQKIIILGLFYIFSWILVIAINKTIGGKDGKKFSNFVKFSILPGSMYIVCFNSFFYNLYSKYF